MPSTLPRPQFLRAFARWADERRDDLPFKLRLILRRRNHLVFSMAGIHPALTLVVTSSCGQDVSICVDHADHFWDFIHCYEAKARRVTGGYQCHICVVHPADKASPAVVWPSREALWADHFFDPLIEWMSGPLSSAKWLDICATDDRGMTWAKMSPDGPPPESLRYRLPIRI